MKKNLLTLIAFIVLINVKAQQGYHIQLSPSNAVNFYKSDTMYMSLGNTNKAYMAIIDQNTKVWKYVNTNYLPATGTPTIKDKDHGILRTPGSNSLLVTSDGWQTVTTSTASFPYINSCPAGYYGHSNIGSSTTMYYSTNGTNWSSATMPGLFTILAARNYANKVYALSGSSSFSCMVSIDGGHTYSYTGIPNSFVGTFIDFYMASVDTFLVFTNNNIYKSFDAGMTWSNTPLTSSITAVAVKNKNEFAVIPLGGTPTFSYTTNGGITWSANINPLPTSGGGIFMYSNNYYYMMPSFRTNDYGATWDHFLPNIGTYPAYSIDFNGSKGLLGLQNGRYSYSTDKGTTFKTFTNTISSNQDMMANKVLSNGNFLAGDRKGQVFTSANNGQSWTQKNTESLSPNALRFLLSANENTIVLTRSGLPVVSTDAGASFSVVTYGTNGGTHLQALKPNGQIMDIRDINGWEMRTFDITGTTSVIATYSSTGSESLGAFYMASDNVGYIMTRDNTNKVNKVYRTNDGGLTFTPKTDIAQVVAGSSAYINAPFSSGTPLIYCFGVDTVIIAANYNNYYHLSYNGGTSWTTVTPAFNPGNTTYGNYVYRMNFFTSTSYIAITGDVFGPKGLYINTSGTPASVGIKELNFDGKKDHLILFPNPSANNNLVSFLNLEEEVQVNIYNMNGQMVRSQITTSGSFSIEDLSSGLYIVSVQEKNKTAKTAKLIIQ